MKNNLTEWKIRHKYTLAEAALLMLGHDPGEWPQSKLIEKPPQKFRLIFGKMVEDSQFFLGYHESEETEGLFFTEYKLTTENPEDITKRKYDEFYTTTSDRPSFSRWAKSFMTYLENNELPTIDGVDFSFFDNEVESPLMPTTEAEAKIHPRLENNYLRLIWELAANLKDFNPTDPYAAARVIKTNTDVDISEQTLASYIEKANELKAKDKMKA